MNEITNLCVEIAAFVCPKLNEEESEHTQKLLSDIMNEAKKISDSKENTSL